MTERLETLLRYRAGELAPEDAKAVEAWPDFAERQGELDALDHGLAALPTSSGDVEALVQRVRRPKPPRPRLVPRWVMRAGIAAAIGLAVWFALPGDEPWVASAVGAGVEVDARPLKPGAERLGRRFKVGGGTHGAQLVSSRGWLGLSAGGELFSDEVRGLALEKGALALAGDKLTVHAGQRDVTVFGQAVISVEPAGGDFRVTGAATTLSPGAEMKKDWLKLSSVALTAATVGGGLTLLVFDGHAQVRDVGDDTPIEVPAGQALTQGERRPKSLAAAREALGGVPTKADEPPAPIPTDLASLEKPQLVALVERLRGERESLLGQRASLQKQVESAKNGEGNEGARQPRNYYRFTPEELVASAKKGEARMRGPQLGGDAFKVHQSTKDDVGLTPDEVAQAENIYRASTERVHKGLAALYGEIGGDANAAMGMSPETVFSEIRGKTPKGEAVEAIRHFADVRAGLAPRDAPGTGSGFLRALFLLDSEDQRTLDELERLLGPRRAEALLNHPKSGHSDHVFGVGPRKKEE